MSNLFGKVVNDQDESLKGKGMSGIFGLNAGFITNIEYTATEAYESVDIQVTIGGQDKRERLFAIKGMIKDGERDLNPGDDGYAEVYEKRMNQTMAVIIHAIKATGVTQAALDAAVTAGQPQDFAGWCNTVIPVAGPKTTYSTKPVDIFLEYQSSFGKKKAGGKYDMTFPTLPKNMLGGYFLMPQVPSASPWALTTEGDGSIFYVNAEGVKHPFERDATFMKSNKGTQQTVGKKGGKGFAAQAAAVGGNPPFGTGATDSQW